MRILLSTIGSRGDVQPLVALAHQLRTLRHEARLCVPPDFREWIEGLGFPVVPIGPDVRQASMARSRATAPPSQEQLRQIIDATVATQFETIGAAAKGCDVIVSATALQVAARSIAETMEIGYVFAAYCPVVLPSPHHAPPALPPAPGEEPASPAADNRELWARNAARTNATFRDALNAHRAPLRLTPIDDVRRYMFTDRPWLPADPTLAPWPDPGDQAVFQTGAWILPDERPLSRQLTAFLEAGEPPLYFGFSSMRVEQNLGQTLIDAARAVGRRAIVSRGWADLSAIDEPDCLTIGEENLQELFTRVAAIVHHGGAGTTTIAALAGTPQVVVPQMYDQHYFARRIQELGIGTAHAAGAPTTESLTVALERTLQRPVAARARAIGADVRRDGAQAAAERLVRGQL